MGYCGFSFLEVLSDVFGNAPCGFIANYFSQRPCYFWKSIFLLCQTLEIEKLFCYCNEQNICCRLDFILSKIFWANHLLWWNHFCNNNFSDKIAKIFLHNLPFNKVCKSILHCVSFKTLSNIKHEYLRSRASTCLSLSLTSPVISQLGEITAIEILVLTSWISLPRIY